MLAFFSLHHCTYWFLILENWKSITFYWLDNFCSCTYIYIQYRFAHENLFWIVNIDDNTLPTLFKHVLTDFKRLLKDFQIFIQCHMKCLVFQKHRLNVDSWLSFLTNLVHFSTSHNFLSFMKRTHALSAKQLVW